jgi:hypothetical protein
MKAREWQGYLEEQRRRHAKALFTVSELANVAGVSRNALNVELSRLRRQGVLVKYAHGIYGLPGAVTPEVLVPAIDSRAYITGMYALHAHNLITQVPARVTCFTDRRSPRARERRTALGRFLFVCVRCGRYAPPLDGSLALPVQALCDFVYLLRRRGVPVEGQVTFRNLDRVRGSDLTQILSRYPSTVARDVQSLVSGPRCFPQPPPDGTMHRATWTAGKKEIDR